MIFSENELYIYILNKKYYHEHYIYVWSKKAMNETYRRNITLEASVVTGVSLLEMDMINEAYIR